MQEFVTSFHIREQDQIKDRHVSHLCLEDAGRELDGVLDGAVEGVDDGGVGVPLPVGLVDRLAELLPVVVGRPDAHADAVLEVL